MAKQRSDLLDYLVYLALRVVTMALHSWGVRTSLALARLVGKVMYIVDRKHRERAMHNLRRSFPGKSDRELRQIARRSMESLCMLAVETLFTPRLIRIDNFTHYVELGDRFDEVVRLMLRKDQGAILLTGHYGNWEVLGFVMATMGFSTNSVARPLDNPYISDFVFGVRETSGQRMITKKGATSEVIDVLDQRGVVGFTADQNAGSKGIFVDFFGRKASAYKSIGLLAMQYNVPVVIGCARRISERFRFRLICQDIIYPQDWQNQDDPLYYITQRYTKATEDFVRADPNQYFWFHRRWKTRPKGEVAEKYD